MLGPSSAENVRRNLGLNPLVNPDVVVRRAREVSVSWTQFAVRIVALIVLFSAAGIYESRHLSALGGSEVWVHLRTGIWILENHAIPRTGLFSQYSNLAWNDSSWGFDLLLGAGYKLLGLRAIPILLMLLKAGVAVVTFLLAYSGRRDFWKAIVLSALSQYVISGLQPLPYVLSVLFFAVELQLLLNSLGSGSVRRLYWLIPIFVLWANLHIQFVAGLALLAVFLIGSLVEHGLRVLNVRWLSPRIVPLPLIQVSATAVVCVLATFATPYGFRLLPDFLKSQYSDVAFVHFSGMASMSFRRPQDYVLMLLVMMAFLARGRRRSLELFELLVLLGCTALAFRIQRDAWLAVLAAIAVLSRMSFSERHESEPQRMTVRTWEWGAVAAAAAIVLAIAAVRLPGRDALMDRIGQNFPVRACDYIVSNKLPAPLFNEYSWGSFLTWYLPEYPVAVDSRVDLYGSDVLAKYFDVVGGKERLDSDPMVARAGTFLLERNSAMAKALRNLPALSSQYRLVYSDEMANVFVPLNQDQNR
jgi:hypothetical protein